jgi:hypothetical protein
MAKRPSLIKSSRKKNTRARTPKFFDEKYFGPEPSWGEEKPDRTTLVKAYNWYNYFYDKKGIVKFLFDHYPRDKKEIRFLKRLDNNDIPSTICYQARMISRGCKLPQESLDYFNQKIKSMLEKAKTIHEENLEEKKESPKPSIQDRIKEQISDYIAEIEQEVDLFTENNCNSEFNMYSWLQKNNIKSQQSNAIAEYYKPLLAELKEAKTKKDEQLNEAYAFMKPRELGRFVDFIDNIVKDASTWSTNQKTVRKTRKRKPPSVEKQVSRVQYLKEFKDYKLVSINPADIIGAQELWVFNAKYRVLTRYDAMGPSGFMIKGTTIQGFDETSISKKLRKPEEILPRVLTGGKRILGKIFTEINSKESKPNGRINKDTVLLKAIK